MPCAPAFSWQLSGSEDGHDHLHQGARALAESPYRRSSVTGRLAGKIALVAGGGRGGGEVLAGRLARESEKVVSCLSRTACHVVAHQFDAPPDARPGRYRSALRGPGPPRSSLTMSALPPDTRPPPAASPAGRHNPEVGVMQQAPLPGGLAGGLRRRHSPVTTWLRPGPAPARRGGGASRSPGVRPLAGLWMASAIVSA